MSLPVSALQLILGILALYHLAIGLVSTVSLSWTAKVSKGLYAITLRESPQFRYAVKMLGLYALTIGGLLSYATLYPRESRPIILAIIFLQSARAVSRLAFNGLVTEAFGISTGRNLFNAGLLVAEVLWLVLSYRGGVA